MDSKKIYEQILTLAKELVKDGVKYTRADLAYELEKLGVSQDSLDVSRLVTAAYEFFNSNESIREAFCNNDGTRSLVDELAVSQLMEAGEHEEAFGHLGAEADNANASMRQLARLVKNSPVEGKEGGKFDIASWIIGTSGVKSVKAAAGAYFEKYSQLVNGYKCAKDDVKATIAEFVDIRGYVADSYREYAMKLMDVFGDSIRSVAPNLFDFDTVEYLDVDEMHKAIQLKYDVLAEKCAMLIQDISTSFFQSLSQSAKAIGSSREEDNTAKLIWATANMWGHYSYASEQGSVAKQELEKFKQDIKHDVTTIVGDYTRLASVFKILNDLYIPKAEAFYKYSEEVFTEELRQLFDILYKDEEISGIARKRDDLLEETRRVERDIADHKLNIEYYKGSIANGQELLKNKQADYRKAVSSKPEKPFFLLNLFTFGNANKKYNKQIYEWKEYMEPVIIEYDNYKAEMKLDSDELRKHERNLKKATDELHKNKMELKNLNRQIADKIKVTDEVKLQFGRHLGNIVRLMHIAKDVVESKLDAKHVKTVQIKDFRKTELPEEIESRLNTFKDSLEKSLTVSVDGEEMEEDDRLLLQSGNQMVERNLGMLKELSKLMMLRKQGETASKDYDKALEEIRAQFVGEMKKTDDKSAVLMETIRRMNTAANKDELREALLALDENGEFISKRDLEDFLSGNKQIEI